MQKLLLFISILFFSASLHAQVRYDSRHTAIQFIQELDLKDSIQHNIHTGLKNYSTKEVAEVINHHYLQLSDNKKVDYLIKENRLHTDSAYVLKNPNPLFKIFYKDAYDLLYIEKPSFKLYLNPIIDIQFGDEKDSQYPIRFRNTRGFELHGNIDDKVYFYSNLIESQGNFHNYIFRHIVQDRTIPGFSFWKPFRSNVVGDLSGFDYANAQGYLGFPISKHVALEFGHGKHFIGHGYHSLLLEDYSNNYFYLKLNTKIWKLHYQNIWAELAPISTRLNVGDQLLPKKYMTAHYLSFKPNKVFEIGLYEAVIFSRLNQFEFQYLNPVILYRTVEYYLDSPDNVIVGLNGKLNLFKLFSLYGQLAIDDLNLSELRNDAGWWGNKFGIQAGVFYPNLFGVNHLNVRIEGNIVRPFTYSHRAPVPEFENYSIANYSHFNQPLAHPLGSNFGEALAIIDYQLSEKIYISTQFSYAIQGLSNNDFSNGDNILIPDIQREGDFGVSYLQGERNTITSFLLEASYSFFHDYYLDFDLLLRSEDARGLDTQYFSIGIRSNISKYHLAY